MSGAVRRTRSTGAATTASSSSSSSRSRKRTADDSDGGESDTSTTRTRKSLKTIPAPVNEEDEDMDPYAEQAASTSSASTLTPSKRKDTSDDDTTTKRARMTPSKRSTRTSTNGNVSPPRRVTRGSSRTRDVKPTSSASASLETIPDEESVLTRVPSLISRNPRGCKTTAAAAAAPALVPAPTSESEPSATTTSTTETVTVTRTSSSPQMDRVKTQSWDYRDQVTTSASTSSSTPPSTTSSTSTTTSTDVDADEDVDVDDEEWATQRERYVEMEKRVREGLTKAGQEISPKISQLFTRLTDRSNTLSLHDANVIEQEIMELLRNNGSLHVGVYDASHPSPHYELEPEFTRGLAVEDIPIPSTVLEQENFAMVVDSGALNVATKMLEIDPQLVNQVGGLSRAPALSYAIKNHDLNMVRFLLNHRANPTIRDDKGNTPLHYCAIHKNADAIPLLLECGALPDLKTRNTYGLTPIGEGQKRQFYINLNDYGIAQYGQCSYLQTQTNRSAQWFYECVTCDLVGEKGCCDVCVARCHQGHQVRLVDLPSRGFCDCGSQGPDKCKALDLPDTDLTTKPPIYIPGSHLSQLASASTTSGRPQTRRTTTPSIPPPWQPTPYEPVTTTTPRDPQMDAILKMMEQLLQERTKLDAIKTKAEGEGKDKKKRRKRASLSVSDLLKYAIVFAFTAILLFILWDTYHASIAVGIEEQRAEGIVRQQTARDQYVHDCIDKNITGLRRVLVYNTKRNLTGHLIDDADCERYKRYMAMDPLKLAQGEGKIVARKIAETMNSFFSNLSAKTIGAWYLCQQGIEGIAQKASIALDYLPYGNVIRGLIQAGSAASAGTTTK